MKLIQKLRKIYLIDVFFSLKGNPRACVWLKPLWGIPYHLYCPFVALFMTGLGLNAYDIGIVTGINYVSQAISSVLSGVLTDKLGRRRTTLIFDTLSWSVPTLLWMFAQNRYWFMVAALFNGMWRITDNSWGLLLVEDADRDKIVPMYSLTSIMGLVSAFFAPLSSIAVAKYGVTPTMRVLYGLTCLLMTTKFVSLYFLSEETTVGKRRVLANQNKSIFLSLWECKDVFMKLIREKRMLLTLGIMACFSLVNTLQGNYFAIYQTQMLSIPDSYMAIFSLLTSIVRLICMFAMARWIQSTHFKNPMLLAWTLFILGQVTLLLNPGGVLAVPVTLLEVLLESTALAILYPMTSSLLFINAEVEERARINGMVYAVVALITAVFPVIIGYFTNSSLKVPFVTTIVVYLLGIWMTLSIAKLPVPSAPEGEPEP